MIKILGGSSQGLGKRLGSSRSHTNSCPAGNALMFMYVWSRCMYSLNLGTQAVEKTPQGLWPVLSVNQALQATYCNGRCLLCRATAAVDSHPTDAILCNPTRSPSLELAGTLELGFATLLTQYRVERGPPVVGAQHPSKLRSSSIRPTTL